MKHNSTCKVIAGFLILLANLILPTQALGQEQEVIQKSDMLQQLWRNTRIAYRINKTENYRWNNFSLGTGYGRVFETEPKLSWQIGLDYNRSRYHFFHPSAYSLIRNRVQAESSSISIPVSLEYDLYQQLYSGVKLFTGPVYEFILHVSTDRNSLTPEDFARNQFGWMLGSKIQLLGFFSLRLSYEYYPTGLFRDGQLNRSAILISLGF